MPLPPIPTPPVLGTGRPLPPAFPIPGPGDPAVQVDFVVRENLLHVTLENTGPVAAFRVHALFDPPFKGLGGRVVLSDLELFKETSFLAPHRCIEAFVDTLEGYLNRREPEKIGVTLTFSDEFGKTFRRHLVHQLGIYRDLPRVSTR